MGLRMAVFFVIPATLCLMGVAWKAWPPSMDRIFLGYRSPYAMTSKQVWEFTQRYSASILVWTGAVMGMVTLSILSVYRHSDPSTLRTVYSKVCTGQIVGVAVPIALIELTMRRRFDNRGNLR